MEKKISVKDLLMQADVLSLHCPLTQHNRGMINAATLAQCKPGAILVNTARGGLIDDVALAAALKAGTLRWAALDSFHSEPLTTPHIWQAWTMRNTAASNTAINPPCRRWNITITGRCGRFMIFCVKAAVSNGMHPETTGSHIRNTLRFPLRRSRSDGIRS